MKNPKNIIVVLLIALVGGSTSLITMPANAEPKTLFHERFNDGSADGLTILSGAWSVVNKQLYVSQGTISSFDKIVTESDFPDNIVVTAKTTQISGYSSTGLLLRYQDAQHYYEIVLDNAANSNQSLPARGLGIYKVSTNATQINALGTWQQPDIGVPYLHLLGGRFFPFEFHLNQTYTLRVRIMGSTFLVYVDGQLLLAATDSDNPYTGGKVGLCSFDTEATFDDLIVTQPGSRRK